MFKCVLFDCDGVLVSAGWKALFDAYKAQVDACFESGYWRVFFKNLEEFKKWWNPDWQENNKRIGITDFNIEVAHKAFYSVYNSRIGKLEWVDGFLGEVNRQCVIGLVTNRHRNILSDFFGHSFSLFSVVIGAEDIKKLKPDPEAVNLALEKLGMKDEERSQVLFIGDTTADILAGKAAGVKTAAVVWEWGLGREEDFVSEETKPDFFFRTQDCFRKILLE